jgi:hypothetical protein
MPFIGAKSIIAPAIDDRAPSYTVLPATNRHLEAQLAHEVDRVAAPAVAMVSREMLG